MAILLVVMAFKRYAFTSLWCAYAAVAGADAVPTGRVVAFSNSVVFQSTYALFKQVPRTNFIWHEISPKFAP